MEVNELLKPRYKVIADYPGNHQPIGHVYTVIGDMASTIYWSIEKDKYPHLFKPLHWSEDRKPEDMPGYVKYSRGVFKVKNWHNSPGGEVLFDILNWKDKDGWSSHGGNFWINNVGLLPATEQEYNDYITQLK